MHRYLVMVMRRPDFDTGLIQAHRDFLAQLCADGVLDMAGPFTDGTGGAYLMRAGSLEQATAVAHQDPLHAAGASTVTVHEWNAA